MTKYQEWSGWRTTLLAVTAAMLIVGCVSQRNILTRTGDTQGDADDAVGYVTVSTPLFSPIDGEVTGEDRLRFGDMKTESAIAKMLETPSFGSKELTLDMFRLALAARIAGVALDIEETDESTQEQPATEVAEGAGATLSAKKTSKKKRTFKTPEAIEDSLVALPGTKLEDMKTKDGMGIFDAFYSLLVPDPKAKYVLPPDEIATLIAGLKTYMVNLEQYYNVDGYDYARGLSSSYVPYKMQFTVTAEPGWLSRYEQYDAVCEVTCRLQPSEHRSGVEDLVILNASPSEVGQVVKEFAAALNQFAAAADVQAPIQDFAMVRARAEQIIQTARQLEGMRAHKTLVVGFPSSNKMRIRFTAQRAATERGYDLQPISRLITATVLVPTGITVDPARFRPAFDARALAADTKEVLKETRLGKAAADSQAAIGQALAADLADALERYKAERGRLRLEHQLDRTLELAYETAARILAEAFDEGVDGGKELLKRTGTKRGLEQRVDATARALYAAVPRWVKFMNLTRGGVDDDRALGDQVINQIKRGDWVDNKLYEVEPSRYGGEELRVARSVLVKETMRAFERAYMAIKVFGLLDELVTEDLQCRWEENRRRVRQFLRGDAAQVTVQAFYSPSVIDSAGRWNPPRDYLVRVDPPSDRLIACGSTGSHTAPIPPWMGPLDQRLKVTEAKGYYALDLVARNEALAQKDLLGERKKTVETKLATLRTDHAMAWEKLDDARKAVATAERENVELLLRALPQVALSNRVVQRARADVTREEAKSAEKRNADRIKRLENHIEAEKRKIEEQERLIREAEDKLATAREGPATVARVIPEAAAMVATEEELTGLRVRLAAIERQLENLTISAVGRGHAVIQFTYEAPPLVLDEREELVRHTEVYARVLGLGRAAGNLSPREPPACDDETLACCAPGAFCKVTPGTQDFAIHVHGIDLSFAVTPASGSNEAKPRPLRAFLQVLVVPEGMDPVQGITDPAAQVEVRELQLESRVDMRPAPAEADMAKTAAAEAAKAAERANKAAKAAEEAAERVPR